MPNYLLTVNGGPEGIFNAAGPSEAEAQALAKGGTARQLTPEEEAIYAPISGRVVTQVEFLRRFTQGERIAIRSAAKVNAAIEDYQYLLDRSLSGVSLDDNDVVAGVNGLVEAGILSPARAAAILGT